MVFSTTIWGQQFGDPGHKNIHGRRDRKLNSCWVIVLRTTRINYDNKIWPNKWISVKLRLGITVTQCIALMTYYCIHGWSPVYFRDIYSPIVSVAFRSRIRSADNDDHVLGRRVMVHAVSASRHPRFGTCYHLISRTVVLVVNSSNRALRLGSLCKPTHKRRL